jgi:predicted DNA-binding transcriptional regulator YafY
MYNLPIEQNPKDAMDNIIQGATNRQSVAIRYRDTSNELSERVVEPYEIKNGKLFAHCQSKGGIRAFAITNILAAIVTDTPYEPRFPVKIQPPMKS